MKEGTTMLEYLFFMGRFKFRGHGKKRKRRKEKSGFIESMSLLSPES